MSSDLHDSDASSELDPDEPRTPLWLPLVGLGLFLVTLTYVLVDGEGEDTAPPGGAAAGAAQNEPANQNTDTAE